jgi:predicted dehydrogenase
MMKRRNFLHTTAAAGMAAGLARGQAAKAADGLRVGLIGCGWYGKNDVARLMQVAPVEVLSVCDVDSRMLGEAAALVARRQASRKEPARFTDFREMLAAKNLDLVIIGTPDHWHTLPAIAAIEAGAHVYLQKPVSVDVLEGEAILAAARQHRRVVQIGTQRRSTPHLIEAREKIIGAGKLGTVGHVDMFCYYHMRHRGQAPDSAPPPHLDWDMWTGPAPLRPYHEGIHPGAWRAYREYGNGILGDMCVHMLDTARWLLDLGWPKRISSAGGIFVDRQSRANVPDTQVATFDFENLTAVWQHRTWGRAADPEFPWALVIYGDKGTLRASVHRYEFIPAGKTAPEIAGEALLEKDAYPEDQEEARMEPHAAPATRRHFQNLLARIADGGRPVADIEEGHISSASCILANLSQESGRTLAYDPASRTIPGDAAGTALLRRPYREPWRHPAG